MSSPLLPSHRTLRLVILLGALSATAVGWAAICPCVGGNYPNFCAGSQYACVNVTCTFECLQGTCGGCTEPNGATCTVGAAKAAGTSCTSDGNPCTTDACNGAGTCAHTNPTAGTVCGAACIAAGTCCNAPNSCVGGKVCSGAGGSCACPGGSYDCGGTCVPTSTCCNNPNNCPGVPNGAGVCSGVGGSCSITCSGGYKVCGSSCIPNAMCCTNADCPSDPANNRSGVCAAGGCAYQCNAGYKACGATCIPSASCCANADCMSPPNACYKTAGTCAAGTCTYPLNNGATCNADGNACTPNDKCNNGACVADTANQVVCVQRACHTAPACNTTTGNCDDANLPNATACGGNGCAAPGTCTAGVCSSPDKDCSALNSVCKVGICDPALPMATNCSSTNKMNGLACALADKCQLTPGCSGGECVGTPKSCTPSGPCRVAECNSATGDCEETVAPAGTSCAMAGACTQNALCDSNGNCNGDPVPDGSPCDLVGCTAFAACSNGQCACLENPDFGEGSQSFAPSDLPDMGAGSDDADEGCSMSGSSASLGLPFALILLLVLATTRSRHARRR